MEKMKLVHALSDYVDVLHDQRLLFRYNYALSFDPWEARKPYLHPINPSRVMK
jgi:hypothetical protein